MSKLRVQGGKLCVVAGQLEQCCQPSTIGCDTPDICLRVTFAGLQLQEDCPYVFVQQAPPGCPSFYTHPELLSVLGGVNRSFRAAPTGVPLQYAAIVPVAFTYTVPACGPRPAQAISYSEATLIVNLACVDDTLKVTSISFYAGLSPFCDTLIFSWDFANGGGLVDLEQPVANLNGCNCIAGTGSIAHSGFAVVEALVDQSCQQDPIYTVAALCDDPLTTISVDLTTNTDGKPGVLYQGELYRLTPNTTTNPPVTVEWVDEQCGQATGDRFRLATRCPNGRRPGNYPETIRCPIDTQVGTSLFILASGGNGLICVIRYVATDQTTDDESLQIGTPTTRTACSGLDYCIDPNGGTGDQPSDLSDLCFICTGPAQPPVCSVPAVQTYLQSNCGRRLPGSLTQTSTPRGKPCLPCQQRRDAGLEAALAAQRAASGCRGCGDAGGEALI